VAAALQMAVATRGGGVDGVIFHSDRGSEALRRSSEYEYSNTLSCPTRPTRSTLDVTWCAGESGGRRTGFCPAGRAAWSRPAALGYEWKPSQ
jgi:hypothetical protein